MMRSSSFSPPESSSDTAFSNCSMESFGAAVRAAVFRTGNGLFVREEFVGLSLLRDDFVRHGGSRASAGSGAALRPCAREGNRYICFDGFHRMVI